LITLATCVLWVDYVFFRDYPWSAVNFLSKVLTILIKVFGPLFSSELYWWVGEFVLPAGMIVSAIILLYISVARAKVAMSKATPPAGEAAPLPNSAPTPELVHQAQVAVASPSSSKPWRFTLAGKLTRSFVALALVFGAAASIIAYTRLAATFETEMKDRANLSVIGLREVASRYGNGSGEMELQQAVDEYQFDESIAYVYVEDAEGRIIAHTPQELPTFLLRDFPRTAERALNGAETLYRGLPVYEIAARMGENKFGYVHLAIWRHTSEAEARRVVTAIAISILLSVCATVAVFAWAVWYFTLPLSNLGLYAHRISRGEIDLDIEIKENEAIQENNEVGSLARSFARMRSSLHAILTRLEGAQPNHFNEIK
jgi:HAMP domain-containing protein